MTFSLPASAVCLAQSRFLPVTRSFRWNCPHLHAISVRCFIVMCTRVNPVFSRRLEVHFQPELRGGNPGRIDLGEAYGLRADHSPCSQAAVASLTSPASLQRAYPNRAHRGHRPHQLPEVFPRHALSMSYVARLMGQDCLSPRAAVTLQLHRSYCAIATQEHSDDPLGSPYGSSVSISLRSASALLATAEASYDYMVTLHECRCHFLLLIAHHRCTPQHDSVSSMRPSYSRR
jgi:hypothetical protein